MKKKVNVTIKTDTTPIVSAETIINIKTLQRLSAAVVEAKTFANDAGKTEKAATGEFALLVFKALHQGLDVSYKALKERLSDDQLSACKGPASKANTLYSYLKKGYNLEVDERLITIATVIDEGVVISTAYTALSKATKAGKEAATLATLSALEEVEAYLESGNADKAHLSIPTDTLTTKLAMDGDLGDVRKIGREFMAKKAAIAEATENDSRIQDYILYLQKHGYTVTKNA
jgi:hypothetical protein